MNPYSESQTQVGQQLITSHFIPYPSQRMWDEIQVYAVPDSFVSAPRFVRLCPQIRSSLPPDSLIGLEFEILQCQPCSWGGVERLWKLPFVFVRYVISSATLPFVWAICKKEIPDTVSHRSGDFHIEALFRRY